MDVLFEAAFAKDLRRIRDKKLRRRIQNVITEVKSANNLDDVHSLIKMQGYDTFYRVRLGNYRIGVELVGTTLIFVRALHRKDIYRKFPKMFLLASMIGIKNGRLKDGRFLQVTETNEWRMLQSLFITIQLRILYFAKHKLFNLLCMTQRNLHIRFIYINRERIPDTNPIICQEQTDFFNSTKTFIVLSASIV